MDPYIGEIRMFAGSFAPVHWAFCNGSLIAISQNSALFSLLATTYGGDGVSTFALPDMRGRIPVHQSNAPAGGLPPKPLGQSYGSESVTLTESQMPNHTHSFLASTTAATTPSPSNAVMAAVPSPDMLYLDGSAQPSMPEPMNPQAAGNAGGNSSHSNMMPFTCIAFITCMQGLYPARN